MHADSKLCEISCVIGDWEESLNHENSHRKLRRRCYPYPQWGIGYPWQSNPRSNAQKLTQEQCYKIVLDLASIRFIGSKTIALLLSNMKEIRAGRWGYQNC